MLDPRRTATRPTPGGIAVGALKRAQAQASLLISGELQAGLPADIFPYYFSTLIGNHPVVGMPAWAEAPGQRLPT